MFKKSIIATLLLVFVAKFSLRADEGMWLPMFIDRLNYQDMRNKGLKLTAEEIYSINNSSLKDAIVNFGNFCTGEVISGEGLILTNHHCGYGVIQEKSTVENDYLANGFWAMRKDQELVGENLTVSFLVRMDDVTKRIMDEFKDSMTEAERAAKIGEMAKVITEEYTKGSHYNAQVKSFFNNNEFYVFVYETFRDVRLVGAPPSSVGKYGGDTDNWMWPRHTGDFAMFRVYAGADGKPADYSTSNVPLKPKHFLPISLNGVKKNDYAMIMGYPGSTDRYLTSYGVQLAIEKEQPNIVKLRGDRLDIMKKYMDSERQINIMYASKYARVSNYWKYFMGQTAGLKRLKVYDKKKEQENQFMAWVNADPERKKRYGSVMTDFADAYGKLDNYQLAQTYMREAVLAVELLGMARRTMGLHKQLSDGEPMDKVSKSIESLKKQGEAFYKDYFMLIDKEQFAVLMKYYIADIPQDLHPKVLTDMAKKHKNDYDKLANTVFSKSIFATEAKYNAFLAKPSAKVLDKDPAFQIIKGFFDVYTGQLSDALKEVNEQLSRAQRLYSEGLRKMNPNTKYYPDANFTMRLTYGSVLDYYPRDAVHYNYITTLNGVMEKEDPKSDEFIVPAKLKELYKNKDYGQYGTDGDLVINFITNNDITGGNSGSPVINGNGELIGTAFDGNWEAMSGDIAFEHDLQRTIVCDIRYVLFIVDKYAGAKHLIDEMKIVKDAPQAATPPTLPAMSPQPAKPAKK